MRKIRVHNPCNEHTRYFRYYNLFWDDLTDELKKKYIVEENRYYEFANSNWFEIHLNSKGNNDIMLLLECEYVIEFLDTNELYVLSVADDLTPAILNQKNNPNLKKVLISQYNYDSISVHVSENIDKFQPWIYFPCTIDDLNVYYQKRNSIVDFNNKMYFRGSGIDDRPILQYINPIYLEGVLPIGGPETYFNDLINYKIGLSVSGRGEFCYRDIEYMALGIPFIRFNYSNKLNPKLIPNYHYISVERPKDLIKDRLGEEKHAKMIEERFLEVIGDNDFLNFVSLNARKYYETYLSRYNNVKHTLNLLGI